MASFFVKIHNYALFALPPPSSAMPVAPAAPSNPNAASPPPPRPPPYMLEVPFMKGVRRRINATENDNYLYQRVDKPGIGKQHVFVTVEKNNPPGHDALIIKVSDPDQESEDEEEHGELSSSSINFRLSPLIFNSDQITWEMKNGVFSVMIPKVNKEEEDRSNVYDATDRLAVFSGLLPKRDWCVKEEEGKGLALRIDMPGLSRDHVKVYLDKDGKTLVIKGKGAKESKYEWYGRRFTRCKLDLTNFSKTERNIFMENGVFILTIPPK